MGSTDCSHSLDSTDISGVRSRLISVASARFLGVAVFHELRIQRERFH